ncbi:MAG: hypothetical protein KBG52_08465, partial [Neisseria sp.]|nr:hypothetical protein [Neisseria sp.]
GSVHISSRGNILAQKRICCVKKPRKVSTLLRFLPCICILRNTTTHKRNVRTPKQTIVKYASIHHRPSET